MNFGRKLLEIHKEWKRSRPLISLEEIANRKAHKSKLIHVAIKSSIFGAGLLAVDYGTWMIYKPVGVILGGVMLVGIAYVMDVNKAIEEIKNGIRSRKSV